jgi:hypothetical protein
MKVAKVDYQLDGAGDFDLLISCGSILFPEG